MKRVVVYPGSFDPYTNGHHAVVEKASKAFDEVVILIAVNADKKRRYPVEDMLKKIRETLVEQGMTNVKVDFTDGFVADYASKINALYFVKGLRTTTDYAYEEDMADKNERLSNIDTLYFRAGALGYISSSYVMALFGAEKAVDELVPRPVLEYMLKVKASTPKKKQLVEVRISYLEKGSMEIQDETMSVGTFAIFMAQNHEKVIINSVKEIWV